MKNFIYHGKLPVTPILNELVAADAHWSIFDTKFKAFSDTKQIPLRSRIPEEGKKTSDWQQTEITQFADIFPCTLAILESVAAVFDGELGVAFFVDLPPGNIVHPHIDLGSHFAIRDRYHIVIETTGSDMIIGDEHAIFRTGELWWFNNKVIHHSENKTFSRRIHLIFDLLSKKSQDDFYRKRLVYSKIKQLVTLSKYYGKNIEWDLIR